MTKGIEIFEQVEAFILNDMNEEEYALFVQKLESDIKLKKETEKYSLIIHYLSRKNIDTLAEDIQKAEIELDNESYFDKLSAESDESVLSAVELFGDYELKKDIEIVEKEIKNDGYFDSFKSEEPKTDKRIIAKRVSLRRIIAVAASICIAIGGAIWIVNISDNSKASAAAYSDWDNSQVEKELLSLESIGFANSDKLRDEDFKETLTSLKECADNQCRISHLELYLSKYPNDLVSLYFKARILFSQRSYDESLIIWQKLMHEGEFKYATDSEWYYVLTLFESEGCDRKVKAFLQKIINTDDNHYINEARNLLKSKECLK